MKERVPFKKEKMQEKILLAVNSLLRFKIADPALQFVSMTKVELNDDLSMALIYWDSFNTEKKDEYEKILLSLKGKVRSMLALKLKARFVPEISFRYDGRYEAEKNIENILKEESSQGKF